MNVVASEPRAPATNRYDPPSKRRVIYIHTYIEGELEGDLEGVQTPRPNPKKHDVFLF